MRAPCFLRDLIRRTVGWWKPDCADVCFRTRSCRLRCFATPTHPSRQKVARWGTRYRPRGSAGELRAAFFSAPTRRALRFAQCLLRTGSKRCPDTRIVGREILALPHPPTPGRYGAPDDHALFRIWNALDLFRPLCDRFPSRRDCGPAWVGATRGVLRLRAGK